MKFTSLSSLMVLGIVSCLGVSFLAAAFPHTAFAQVDARLLGAWKVNIAKSTFDPGPPPKTMTVTREQVGDAVKYTFEYEDANGIHTTIEETPKFDGKDYPRTITQYPRAGAPLPDTIALKRIDADTVEETLKMSGKVMQTARQVISKDGKGITTTVTGTDVIGRPVHVVLVYEKQ